MRNYFALLKQRHYLNGKINKRQRNSKNSKNRHITDSYIAVNELKMSAGLELN
jgi:hypothetical protein